MTLHGPGFGLDERDCFEAQLSGVLRAIELGRHPPSLGRVVFVELDARRAARLQGYLDTASGQRAAPGSEPVVDLRELSDRVVHDRQSVFAAMPFAKEFEDVFNFGIQGPVHEAGFRCERMDQVNFVGDVVAEMRKRIQRANFVVADLTGANPNVYLEVGFAWACARPVVLLARNTGELRDSLHFDTRGHRCLHYETITELSDKLRAEIAGLRREGVVGSHA